VCAAWYPVLFQDETFVQRDALTYLLTSRAELSTALRAGRVPEWTAGIGLGAPFAANPIHGVLYPPAWLSALLPLSFGTDLSVLLHVLLGAAGTAALARRFGAAAGGSFVAGGAFAASGYVSSMVANNNAHLLAWTPWVAWAAQGLAEACERGECRDRWRAALPLSAFLGAQLIVGEPAHVVTAGLLALGLTLVGRRRWPRGLCWLAGAVAGALLLAGASILPSLSLLAWSDRAEGVQGVAAEVWAMPPLRLTEWLWPGLLGDPTPIGNLARVMADATGGAGGLLGPNWAFTLYLGGPVLLLSTWEGWRGRRACLLLAAGFVVLAMGHYTPLQPLFRTIFPLERLVRYPEKHVLGAVVLLTALAGAGFDGVLRAGQERRLMRAALAMLGCIGAGLALLSAARAGITAAVVNGNAALLPPAVDPERAMAFALSGGIVAVTGMAAFSAGLWLRGERSWLARAAPPLLGFAVLGPLLWNARSFVQLADREVALGAPPVLRPAIGAVRPGAPPPRVYLTYTAPVPSDYNSAGQIARAVVEQAYSNLPARFGLQCVPGEDSTVSSHYARFQGLAAGMSMRRYARLLGVEWMLLPGEVAPSMPWMAVAESDRGAVLFSTDQVRPRAFVAPRWRPASAEEALTALAAPGRDADLGLVVVEAGGPPPAASADAAPLSPCAIETPVPEEVRLRCDSPAGGWAVLLDQEAPGWSATVDGSPSPIARADGLFRAVAVSAGPHEVRFRYRTPGLRAGLAISLLAWLAWGLAWRRAGR
jgi:hypothetical protein